MAKKIKVYEEEVNRIGTDLERLFGQLEEVYARVEQARGLIDTSWRSRAATSYLNAITEQQKELKKLKKTMMENRDFVNKSSKRVVEKDKAIKAQLSKFRV